MNSQHSSGGCRQRAVSRLAVGRLVSAVAIALCALLGVGINPALANPGQLDIKTTLDFGGIDSAQAVLPQFAQPGKVVAVGGSINASTGSSMVALTRYQSNGTIDQLFGPSGNGKTIWAPTALSVWASSAVFDMQGKIVVAGTATAGTSTRDFFVARFSANGILDTTFHYPAGYVTTNFGGPNDEARDVVVQPWDNGIVVVGTGGVGSSIDVALARYNNNGSLDNNFNGTGMVLTNAVSQSEIGSAVALQGGSNPGIVVAGYTSGAGASSGLLLRYTPTGALSYSVTTNLGNGHNGFQAVTLDASGRILAGGTYNSGFDGDFVLARYSPANGALDMSFNGTGTMTTPMGGTGDTVYGIVAYSNYIVAVGTTSPFSGDFALARYWSADGSPDLNFGIGGKVLTDFPGGDSAYAATLYNGATAQVVAAGSSSGNFALARYNLT